MLNDLASQTSSQASGTEEIEHRSGISSIYVLVIELEIKYLPLLYLQSSSINIDPIA